jgi:hypothetical protein
VSEESTSENAELPDWPDENRVHALASRVIAARIQERAQDVDDAMRELWDLGGVRAMFSACWDFASVFMQHSGIDERSVMCPDGTWGFSVEVYDDESGEPPRAVSRPDGDPDIPAGELAALRFVMAIANNDADAAVAAFNCADTQSNCEMFAGALIALAAESVSIRMRRV